MGTDPTLKIYIFIILDKQCHGRQNNMWRLYSTFCKSISCAIGVRSAER